MVLREAHRSRVMRNTLDRREGSPLHLPDVLETSRLRLRRPMLSDAQAIFERWASDATVTRYMSWPRHRSIDDSSAFIAISDEQWARWPAGPYLIETLSDSSLVGSCGFGFQDGSCAEVGYVLARSAWGYGYATECLHGLVTLAASVAPIELFAPVHPDNAASIHVLEKSGFALSAHDVTISFPNISDAGDVRAPRYSRTLCQGAAV